MRQDNRDAENAVVAGDQLLELGPGLHTGLRLEEDTRVVEADPDVIEVGRRLVEPELTGGPAQQIEHGIDHLVCGGLAHELTVDRTGLEECAREPDAALGHTLHCLTKREVIDDTGADNSANQRSSGDVRAGAADPALAEPDHTADHRSR